ncbi:hypothetical protein HM1_2811 [Heliomicrobium modesticaldum Ice1]|uniref:Uncharacterized protein n=1 Tax=Heliobacterium modesticaldum (strain ATCC 51547 / Ice1) TaxID=498761 RepID=B0TCF2_HELMI|nr:hypothetical protein [Heliomicrobium modesticaldum]ABZ85340.1 hypothetical protein HM1_2811 [Heliomicrobium modesticaldum Ice1]
MIGKLVVTLLSGAAAYSYAEKKYNQLTERKIVEGLQLLRPVVTALCDNERKRVGIECSSTR